MIASSDQAVAEGRNHDRYGLSMECATQIAGVAMGVVGAVKGAVNTKAVGERITTVKSWREKGKTEIVYRWMSKAELESLKETGLVRGGRDGTHYVTDAPNKDAIRARQRSALPQTPEVLVKLEVPKGVFSKLRIQAVTATVSLMSRPAYESPTFFLGEKQARTGHSRGPQS